MTVSPRAEQLQREMGNPGLITSLHLVAIFINAFSYGFSSLLFVEKAPSLFLHFPSLDVLLDIAPWTPGMMFNEPFIPIFPERWIPQPALSNRNVIQATSIISNFLSHLSKVQRIDEINCNSLCEDD